MKMWVLGATVLSVGIVKRVFQREDKEADCRAWPAFKLDDLPKAQPTPDEADPTPVGLPAQQRPSLLLHPILQLLAGLALLNVCLWVRPGPYWQAAGVCVAICFLLSSGKDLMQVGHGRPAPDAHLTCLFSDCCTDLYILHPLCCRRRIM